MSRSPAQQVRLLKELMAHDGWGLVVDSMREEIAVVTRQLSSSPSMPADELHWRRGVIFAAQQLLGVPERLQRKIENDAILAAASAAAKQPPKPSPATAGQKGSS